MPARPMPPVRCLNASYEVFEDRSDSGPLGFIAACNVCGGRGWGIAPERARRAVRHIIDLPLPGDDFNEWGKELET